MRETIEGVKKRCKNKKGKKGHSKGEQSSTSDTVSQIKANAKEGGVLGLGLSRAKGKKLKKSKEKNSKQLKKIKDKLKDKKKIQKGKKNKGNLDDSVLNELNNSRNMDITVKNGKQSKRMGGSKIKRKIRGRAKSGLRKVL